MIPVKMNSLVETKVLMVAAEKIGGKVLKVCVCNPDLFALDNSRLEGDIGYRIKYMTMHVDAYGGNSFHPYQRTGTSLRSIIYLI